MKKTKLKINRKKLSPKTRYLWFFVSLIVIALGASIFSAVSLGTGPLSFIFSPAEINLVGGKSVGSSGRGSSVSTTTNNTKTNTSKSAADRAGDPSSTTTYNNKANNDTNDPFGGVVGVASGKNDKGDTTLTKTQKNPDGTSTTITETTVNGNKTTTSTIKDSKGNVILTTTIGSQVSDTGEKNIIVTTNNRKTGENTIVKSGNNGEKPVVTQFKVAPDPVFGTTGTTTTATTTNTNTKNKVNCDAGTCGTNGSPVCSGAYVFTGGNANSSNKSDGTYGCVQCQGGSLSREVKDCNKLIEEGEPVVLPYDANNKWLSSVKTDGMTAPCFINRGGNWVQAAVGQQYEGADDTKKGSVCNGSGGWDPPTTKGNTSNNPAPNVTTTTPVVKKSVCNGGSMVGLVLDAHAIASGGPLGIITGTIDGVRTVINCANAENPSFSFCRTKAGIDKEGNCIADTIVAGAVGTAFGAGVTDPVAVGAATGGIVSSNPELVGAAVGAATGGIALTPAGIAGGIGAAGGVIGSAVGQVVGPVVVQAAKDHPIMTGFGVGCVAGGTAGMILGPIGGIGGCIVGSVVGGITGYSYGNASQESNDSRDGSSLTSPSTLSQGGSGLNTGPINEINSPVNTAGQTGGNSLIDAAYEIFMQTGALGSQTINVKGVKTKYDTSMSTSGCGPATLVNILKITGKVQGMTDEEILNKVLHDDNFYVACTEKGCSSGADSVLTVLEREYNYAGAATNMKQNQVLNANDLKNATGMFVYQGEVIDPTISYSNRLDHNALIVCENGNCSAVDSYTSDTGKPTPCDVKSSRELQCGDSTYLVETSENTKGIASSLYAIPGVQ